MRNKSDFLYSFYPLVVYLFLPLHFPQLFPIYCVEGCLSIEEEALKLFSFLCICFLSCVLIYMYMYVIHRDSSSSESRLCFLPLYFLLSLAFPSAPLRRSYILYSVYYPFTVAYFVCYFSFSSVFRKALSILYYFLLFLLVLFKLLLCNYSYFIF